MDTAQVLSVYGDTPAACEPRIQAVVDSVFIDPDGLVIGAVKSSTLLPYTLGDMAGVPVDRTFTARASIPPQYRLVAMNYEESGMAHGDFLMAMLDKYAVTGHPADAERARTAFHAIRQLCETVAETNPYGRGWWPKPYGGMRDLNEMFETSIDQTTKIVSSLRQFRDELATHEERTWCDQQLLAIVDWWERHHFATTYFGNCCWWDLLQAPHAAAALLQLVQEGIQLSRGRQRHRFEHAFEYLFTHRHYLLLARGGLNAMNLAVESCRRLDELAPAHTRIWRRAARFNLRRSLAELDPDDGTHLLPAYGRYNTGLRAACSAVTIYGWLGDRPAAREAWRLLHLHNRGERFFHHHQGEKPPPSHVSWWHDALSGHHYTAWLLAYWRLKRLG